MYACSELDLAVGSIVGFPGIQSFLCCVTHVVVVKIQSSELSLIGAKLDKIRSCFLIPEPLFVFIEFQLVQLGDV